MARFDVSVDAQFVLSIEADHEDAAIEAMYDWMDRVKKDYDFPDFELLDFDGVVSACERLRVSDPVPAAKIAMLGGNNTVAGDSFVPAGGV